MSLTEQIKDLTETMEEMGTINSATQYPSIPMYHKLGERGRLLPERTLDWSGVDKVYVTEKIDGTNARIILPPAEVGDTSLIIGSRQDLLFRTEDTIWNPAMGIVDTLFRTVDLERLEDAQIEGHVTVIFGEVYGHKGTPAWKQYGNGEPQFRVFDVAVVPIEVFTWDRPKIAAWRDSGGQQFLDHEQLEVFCSDFGLTPVPHEGVLHPNAAENGLPETLDGVYRWLDSYQMSSSAGFEGFSGGKPEGFVLRSADRKLIAKARFEDYDRTLHPKQPRRQ